MPARRPKKDSPAKLVRRMKRRWRVILLRSKGELLGEVEAPALMSRVYITGFALAAVEQSQWLL